MKYPPQGRVSQEPLDDVRAEEYRLPRPSVQSAESTTASPANATAQVIDECRRFKCGRCTMMTVSPKETKALVALARATMPSHGRLAKMPDRK